MAAIDIHERRERAYLVLAGFFLCAMTLLNVIGITRFVQLGPMALAVGVLPYPLTFLATDLISELYGRSRANFVVWLGLGLNFFILAVLWLGNAIPAVPIGSQPPWQVLELAQSITLPNGDRLEQSVELFHLIYACTSGAIFASMIAYITAQFCDVWLFHFWRRLTRGKHLWLRNNFSTLISQGVDSVMVISITFGAVYLAGQMSLDQLLVLVGSSYLFKMTVALADTLPFYGLVHWMRSYLQMSDDEEFRTAAATIGRAHIERD
ncbi:MAG: queuosine precursor transporter [Pseudomonadales bacterium]